MLDVMKRRTTRILVCITAVVGMMGFAAPSYASYGVSTFDGSVTADPSGDVSYTQAGGHPHAISTTIAINTKNDFVHGDPWPDEPIKNLLVDVPPGLVGNPTAVSQCSLDDLAISNPLCAPASQVGVASVTVVLGCALGSCSTSTTVLPVFSMVPPPDVPARFGFNVAGTIVLLDAELRSGTDYGLSVNAKRVGQAVAIISNSLTFWGIPADPIHTDQRHCAGADPLTGGCDAGVPPKAFLTLPTSCSGPQTTTLRTDSWFHPGDFVTASFLSHRTPFEGGALQGATDCELVPFDPTFQARPDNNASPGPSGWSFDLRIPQDDITDPDGIAQGHLRSASVTLPAGVRVSPSSATGLDACTPAQIGLTSATDPSCPDASKVGSVRIDTPLLDEQLEGSVFLATPRNNPSGSLVALYLVAKAAGLTIKLPGSVTLDDSTGQLTATFGNNPQLPFSHLHLELFGGSRAALSNPARCGTYTTTAVLTSWSGKVVTTSDSFTTTHDQRGAPCPPSRFQPSFSAGTTTAGGLVPAGGSYSSFALNLSRGDDDEEFAAITSIDMPDGLLAKIADVPLCAAADVQGGTCAEASRIGSVVTKAGPGPDPFAVPGRVYLGGPYQGAPFSLSIVIPAVAGPFDLGTVVVRSAVSIDPSTAKLAIKTDPLPTILQGIPLQVKEINVDIDRPKFIVNPTSCNPKRIGATVVSVAATVAALGSRFKLNDCASLNLSPRMRLVVGSKRHVQKGISTPLSATLTQPPGQTGLKAVSVRLPATLNALLPVVENACTQAEFDSGRCGKKARAGHASATTPLLDEPLRGSVYFVKNTGGKLPNLVVALRGQVDFNLVGRIRIPSSGVLSTHFGSIPDVPIRTFTLKLVSGKNGPLGTTTNLCSSAARRQVARIAIRGHNGKLTTSHQRLKVRGCRPRA